MMNNVVETRGLTVRRGRRTVIDRLDLAVPRGAVVGLLGPSGSGKTTLMRAIVGVQIVADGTVTVLGRPAGSAPLRGRVGYMTQQASTYEDLSVRANLRYFARVRGAPASEVEHVLERTDLRAQADQLARTLSGGQANRVSLAAAMLGSPDLLVLDEPTVGLDPVLRADLWDIFRGLAESGTTLLVSSHVMDEATRCDRLLLMREGEVIADLTPEELLASTGARSAEEAFLSIIESESDAAGAVEAAGTADTDAPDVRTAETGRPTSPGEAPSGYRPRHRLVAAPASRPRGRRNGDVSGEETP